MKKVSFYVHNICILINERHYCHEILKSSLIWYCFPPEKQAKLFPLDRGREVDNDNNAFVAQLNNFQMGWNKCRAMWMGNWDNQNEFSTSQILASIIKYIETKRRSENDNDNDERKSLICLTIWVEGWFCFN